MLQTSIYKYKDTLNIMLTFLIWSVLFMEQIWAKPSKLINYLKGLSIIYIINPGQGLSLFQLRLSFWPAFPLHIQIHLHTAHTFTVAHTHARTHAYFHSECLPRAVFCIKCPLSCICHSLCSELCLFCSPLTPSSWHFFWGLFPGPAFSGITGCSFPHYCCALFMLCLCTFYVNYFLITNLFSRNHWFPEDGELTSSPVTLSTNFYHNIT